MNPARALLLLLLMTGCSAEARAPEVREQRYVVRIAYVTDVKVESYKSEKRCGVTRDFVAKELPPLDGYTLVVRCVAVGNL
jgi:hypothetical protein